MRRIRTAVAALARSRVVFAIISAGVLLIAASMVLPLLPWLDPNAQDLTTRLLAPAWLGESGGLLGTDELGRDLASRILYGLRTTFLVGAAAVLIGMLIGVAAGLSAGYFGGWWDSVVMRLADIQLALPVLLLAMTLIALLGGGATLLTLILGLNSWMLYARMVRGYVLRLRQSDFVASLRASGARSRRVMWLHLLPNCAGTVFAVASLELPRLMLGEATLSFLGFGVKQPTISLGVILSSGKDYISSQWWVSAFSGLTLALAVLATNLLGVTLQRRFDPLSGEST